MQTAKYQFIFFQVIIKNKKPTRRTFVMYGLFGWGIPIVVILLYVIVSLALEQQSFVELYGYSENFVKMLELLILVFVCIIKDYLVKLNIKKFMIFNICNK